GQLRLRLMARLAQGFGQRWAVFGQEADHGIAGRRVEYSRGSRYQAGVGGEQGDRVVHLKPLALSVLGAGAKCEAKHVVSSLRLIGKLFQLVEFQSATLSTSISRSRRRCWRSGSVSGAPLRSVMKNTSSTRSPR